MKLAIMQPYFFPYLGYFQLIHAADKFVVYDDVQYMKGGWINRNRILMDGKPAWISLPVMPDSTYSHINQRTVSTREYEKSKIKILGQLQAGYRKAPFFAETLPLVKTILDDEEKSLAHFICSSLTIMCEYLGIKTPLVLSSAIAKNDDECSGVDRVFAICRATGAKTYINSIGGRELYRTEDFSAQGIDLRFIAMDSMEYAQGATVFVPYLSIIDVLMFNGRDTTQSLLQQYSLQP
ncbi:MAG: WbqC family protein [Cellvibrionales bacterium]|nr:WbqC family protein [Cellvibrionales bacterium]